MSHKSIPFSTCMCVCALSRVKYDVRVVGVAFEKRLNDPGRGRFSGRAPAVMQSVPMPITKAAEAGRSDVGRASRRDVRRRDVIL